MKRSARNPVDTSQLMAYGSVFYVNGYDNDGWVMMQTISGVVEAEEETVRDGGPKEVVAVVAPGKYSPGSLVLVEARHMVAKPKNLDWERGAHLPFQVRNMLSNAAYDRTKQPSTVRYSSGIYSGQFCLLLVPSYVLLYMTNTLSAGALHTP